MSTKILSPVRAYNSRPTVRPEPRAQRRGAARASATLSSHHLRAYWRDSRIDGAGVLRCAGMRGMLSARRTAGWRRMRLWRVIAVILEMR